MKLLLLAVVQSLLLCGGQVLLKMALAALPHFSWSWSFFRSALSSLPFFLCGLCYGAASVLWFYIIKHFPFSHAYPLVSLSYVFGMLAAIFIFHEEITWTGWTGVVLIMAGCYFIAQ